MGLVFLTFSLHCLRPGKLETFWATSSFVKFDCIFYDFCWKQVLFNPNWSKFVKFWILKLIFLTPCVVTFDVSIHKWGWHNSTKVFLPKLNQWGQRLAFGLATIGLALILHPCRDWWIWSSSSYLRAVDNSCTLALPCYHLSPIFALGLAMIGLAYLSSYLYKSTYTTVHRCNLLLPWC